MFDRIWVFMLWLFDFLLIVLKTVPRDLLGLYKLVKHHLLIKYNVFRQRDYIYVFRQNVKRYQSKPCFILDDTSLSFQQVCIKNENKIFCLFL
jgi:hypothetical protein